MTTIGLPDPPRGRLGWALREGPVIAGILLFWPGVAALLTGAASMLCRPSRLLRLEALHLVVDRFQRTGSLWPAFTAVAFATTGPSVVVRAGTLCIDHSHAGGR